MSRSKAKGTTFERLIADHLAATLDDRIDRQVLRGNTDLGDISGVRSPFGKVVLECKNHKTMTLGTWVEEVEVERGNADALVGVVVHKRPRRGKPGEQYVTLTVDGFVKLLGGPTDA